VLRYPAIFLFAFFLAIGPGAAEQAHLRQVNRFWAAHRGTIESENKTPSRRVPVRAPAHDPSTCIVCMALHAAIGESPAHPIELANLPRSGKVAFERFPFFVVRANIRETTRGPPSV
jgi:hypothetical protein